VDLSRDELARRLAEADRVLTMLRKCTREMQAMGRQVVAGRKREPRRPHLDRAAGR
jgi:hypothetical protein